MRALALVVLAILLAGCAVPGSTTTTSTIFVNGERAHAVRIDPPVEAEAAAPTTERTRDPDAPPVTLDGAPTHALAALVRESFAFHGAPVERHPCGGALFAAAADTPDPRREMHELVFVRSVSVLDETGREWTTDHYVHASDPWRDVWVQNLGGGAWFSPDDGAAHCEAPVYAKGPLNALLHVQGPDEVQLWFSPSGRPPRDGPSPS